MCLISFALHHHPDYPLILIANRDEFLQRPTSRLMHWDDPAGITAGRDERAHGTWLAVNNRGRWAALTNFRNPNEAAAERSRGELVVNCLSSELPLEQWFEQLSHQASATYAGYNLVAGDFHASAAYYFSNVEQQVRPLPSGHHAISNGLYDDDWPKMKWLRNELEAESGRATPNIGALFELLKHDVPADKQQLPNTGIPDDLEHILSAPFIQPFSIAGQAYGTRSSAVVTINKTGQVNFFERTVFAEPAAEHHLTWQIEDTKP